MLESMLQMAALGVIGHAAYDIRMFALRIYGLVIHEFDPWYICLSPCSCYTLTV
jgi:hypothetical protein